MFGLTNILTGIDITDKAINSVQVADKRGRLEIIKAVSTPIPEDTIKYSYRTGNIMENEIFNEILRKNITELSGKIRNVGLSLPNEIFKLVIQSYSKVPESEADIREMIMWGVQKSLHFPTGETKISYAETTGGDLPEKSYLIAAGMNEVLRSYESALMDCKLTAKVINPSGICQFNFYSGAVPEDGVIGYLGIFEGFFTVYIFEDGKLLFYQGVKKKYGDVNYIHDIELIIQLFFSEYEDKHLDSIYVASCINGHSEIKSLLFDFNDAEINILKESDILGEENLQDLTREDISFLSPAIGAAVSMKQW